MPWFKRSDGSLLKDLPPFRVLNPYMMTGRIESMIFIPTDMDVTHTLEFIEDYNKKVNPDEKIGIFNVLLSAIVRTCVLRPQLNRFVNNYRIYQRNEIKFSFIAKKELSEKGEERNVSISFDPYVTLQDVSRILREQVSRAKSDQKSKTDSETEKFGRLPHLVLKSAVKLFRWLDKHNLAPADMIKHDPLYVTCYIANVGSIKMESPFHHLFEWGTASLFLGIGKVHKAPLVMPDNSIQPRDVLKIIVSYDDRVSEGIYGAKAIALMRDFIEHPEQLLERPNIPPEIIEELKLKPITSK